MNKYHRPDVAPRIVITGIGVVSPFGIGRERFWEHVSRSGSGGGGIDVGERQYHDFFVERGKRVTPYAIPVSIVGMVSSEISISLRLHGISHVLSCGCTSSTDAIGYAKAMLQSGEVDVIMSGGTDACVTP